MAAPGALALLARQTPPETMLVLVLEPQRKICPVPPLCAWHKPSQKVVQALFSPEILQKLPYWSGIESNFRGVTSCTSSGGACKRCCSFWLAFHQKAWTSSFPKKPPEKPTGINGDMFVVTITIFVYLLLAKFSVSCQYLRSGHSANPALTHRTWYRRETAQCGRAPGTGDTEKLILWTVRWWNALWSRVTLELHSAGVVSWQSRSGCSPWECQTGSNDREALGAQPWPWWKKNSGDPWQGNDTSESISKVL